MESGEHGEGSGSGRGGWGSQGTAATALLVVPHRDRGGWRLPRAWLTAVPLSPLPAGEEAEAGGGHGSHKKKHKKHKKKHKKKHHHEAVGPPPPPAPEPAAGLRKPQLKLKIKLGGQILGTKR